MKILYIEDEPEQINIIRERLEADGYKLITASDGEEGLVKARSEKPDLILVDIFLPKMGGLDLCRLMREDPGLKKVPIIVITGSGVDYVKSQCKAAGADECITKPYRVKALLATIVDLLGK